MNKKLFGLLLSGSMVLALSGCGGGGDGGDGGDGGGQPPISYDSIEIIDLNEGYEISGVNNRNEKITLLYCSDGHYEYYRNSERFTGDYNIVYDEIQMIDKTGSYVIKTGNNYLEVGEVYPCDSLGRDLEVNSIVESNC